ncbi:MAG: transposase [bacterium]
MKEIVRYSEAFRLQVVQEVESGKYPNCHAAGLAYGIRGVATVHRWLVHYGRSHLLRKVVRVETTDERDELKRLKGELRKVKEALADAHLDLRLERAYLAISCRSSGEPDVAGFKKKHAGMLSMALPPKDRET